MDSDCCCILEKASVMSLGTMIRNLVFIFSLTIFFNFFPPSYANVEFQEVTDFAGLGNKGSDWGNYWGDVNSDGLPDLWKNGHKRELTLYVNNGNGTFSDLGYQHPILTKMIGKDNHGASWADFDNDGDQDIISITGSNKGTGSNPNFFLVNNNGILEDKALEFGLQYPLVRGRTPIWLDYNDDGLLDVLINAQPRSDNKAPTALFEQTNNGFLDVTELVGLTKNRLHTTSAQIVDLNNDGLSEIIFVRPGKILVYDLSSIPFNQISIEPQHPVLWKGDVAIGDFNGDLINDIFITRKSNSKEDPLRNDKFLIGTEQEWKFLDHTSQSGMLNPTSCTSVAKGDFDNDMDLDLYLDCSDTEFQFENILYLNNGKGEFIVSKDAAYVNGFGTDGIATSIDYDSDGFLDLFMTNNGINKLFQNLGNDNHWITLKLIGDFSNRDAIGAKVILTVNGTSQLREQTGGMHAKAQDDQRIHFGLGQNKIVDKMTFFWPSGIIQEIKNVKSDQFLNINETPPSPKQQKFFGINDSKIICKKELILGFKSTDGSPVCVKLSTLSKLQERNWIKN